MSESSTAINPIQILEDRQYRCQFIDPNGVDDGLNNNPRTRQTVDLLVAAVHSQPTAQVLELSVIEPDGGLYKFRVEPM